MKIHKDQVLIASGLIILLGAAAGLFALFKNPESFKIAAMTLSRQPASIAAEITSPFAYKFSVDGTLNEAGSINNSSSPYWWVNSGGQMILKEGIGTTIHGKLPAFHRWRLAYALANPIDTEGGYRPQNIFRFITRSKWHNVKEEGEFRVDATSQSTSPNRNESNGVLLFGRYKDGDNFYYAGIRVDGSAIIKKKYRGVYYTLAEKKIFPGIYNQLSTPNLIPAGTWFALQLEITTTPQNTSLVKLYLKDTQQAPWLEIVVVEDKGNVNQGSPLLEPGYAGIRTDFMDVSFDNFQLTEL